MKNAPEGKRRAAELAAPLKSKILEDDTRVFVKLQGTIREPRLSFLQRFKQYFFKALLTIMVRDLLRTAISNKNRIARPPGSYLASIAEFIFSKKTLKDIVYPIISDLQVEYCEALATHRKLKAIWVRIRGYWSLVKALWLYSLLRLIVEVWRKTKLG